MMQSPNPSSLEVYLLGLVDFDDLQRLQRRLVYDLGDGGGGALILCEHPPTISVGRSGSWAHIRPDNEELRDRGISVHWINRGGGCLLHLPGQLSASVILPLDRLRLDLRQHLDRLHLSVTEMLSAFDLRGERKAELPGVFLGHARIASVGVAVNRWVAYHGLTLNVGMDLDPFFDVLDEPGIGTHRLHQTSMEAQRQRPAAMAKVREALVRSTEAVYGLKRHHVYTDHPFIRQKARPRVYAESYG
jgi:lipoyl(octanoyl) transferase